MNEEPVRILVVDDEKGVREGCRKILSVEGYQVTIAEDGQAGWEAFQAAGGGFAVLLVDLMMPRMTGLELMKLVREADTDVLPIIITAHATIDTAVEGTKQGAYSYIPKPFTPDELLLAIKNGLERRALTLEARRLREERERRLLEVAAERSKSNTIIKCITDGILVINTEKLIVLRNPNAARILSDSQQVPFPLEALSCPEVKSLIAEVLDGNSGPTILSREVSLAQATYMVNVSRVVEPGGAQPATGGAKPAIGGAQPAAGGAEPATGGEASGAVAVFRDITALKKLETAKSMFVSMVAHEVKNPLAAAEGWLNLILSGLAKQDPEEEKRMIQRSLVRIRTLRTLVTELLNITAIQTGNFTLRRSPVEVGQLAAEAAEACRDKALEKKIQLGFTAAASPEARALADRDALLMIFSNLIDNAIKYTPEGGHVGVHVSNDGMYVKVSVKDDGIGMEPADRERLFDEFFRAKNDYTANVPGTGLGLALVKRLTEMHQGRVSVESSPGTGSEFAVQLPVC
jgi:two-component system phosphate regulon sensor histidine kinase PhoR